MSSPEFGSLERPWPLSVGDLDAWNYYQGADGMTHETFLKRLNREEPPGAPAIIGQCFHSAIEGAMRIQRESPDSVEVDAFYGVSGDHKVKFQIGTPGKREVEINLEPYTTIEQDLDMTFETPDGWIHLRGVIDGLRGNTVLDLKTTSKRPGTVPFERAMERFQDSWQWRAYLVQMGEQYRTFEYHIFPLIYDADNAAACLSRKVMPMVEIVGYSKMTCHRYPKIQSDLQGVASEIAEYLGRIGWTPPEKRKMYTF